MKLIGFIHVILLVYIIAALSFWWLSLEKQSNIIYQTEIVSLREHIDISKTPLEYAKAKEKLDTRKEIRSKQYLGEGLTFLVVIFMGSIIVLNAYRFNTKLTKQQNNFMLSVTHELKSPLAAIKLSLQTLKRHQLALEKQNQIIDKCVVESDRLTELCNNILIASQMEGGQYKNIWQPIPLHQFIENTISSYQIHYSNRILSGHIDEIEVDTDKVLLQLAVNNLIENALKYSPNDSNITIQLTKVGKRAIIAIKDLGSGIASEEKKKIFKQFYRVGNEITRKTKGTGLGLYLTSKIIYSLKGNVSVKDNVPQGSIFEISLKI